MKLNSEALNIALARKSINIKELSTLTRISTQTLYAYTSKKRKPGTKALGKIAKALDVDVTEILED